jgi:hypothetical protein
VYVAAPCPDQPDARHLRIATGIALSLALHALILGTWRNHPLRLPAEREAPRALEVEIRPLPPKAEPLPAPRPPPIAAPRSRERVHSPAPPKVRPSHDSTRRETVPTPEDRAVPAPEQPAQPAQPEHPAAPRFNAEAARRFARRIADEPDPAKVGTAVAQFPDESYHPHTKIERAIQAAKRGNCKDGIPGGLLAPFILLLDKKDSGCKW